MWSEFSVKPPAALATPSIFEMFVTSEAGIESCAVRHKRVARELLAGVAQVLQPEAAAAVLPTELLALLVGQLLEGPVAGVGKLDWPRHGHVRADTRERFEHLRLRPVETVGKRGYGDDEANADAEAERREDRAAESPPQLGEHVGDVEHARTKP